MHTPKLIVMLTHNDHTAEDACRIFDACKHSKAEIWGFKDKGLPLSQMRELFAYMKAQQKTTALEVVAYTQEEGLEAAKIAKQCGCDFLMGTCYFDSINEFCQENGIRYLPFVGNVHSRPSVLTGNIDDMLEQAQAYLQKGVFGIDLLGYRYTGDAVLLNETVVRSLNAPVCIAGSVNSFARLDEIRALSPWAFTIGGAFFEHKFGASFCEQIDRVIDHIGSYDYPIKK